MILLVHKKMLYNFFQLTLIGIFWFNKYQIANLVDNKVEYPSYLAKINNTLFIQGEKLGIESMLIDHQGNHKLLKRTSNDTCIDREQFVDYLYTFFDFHNHSNDKEIIIIVGSKIGIGKWLVEYYKKNSKYSLLLIKGFFDFEFSNPVALKILRKLNIKRIYICFSPDFESFSTYQDMKELNQMFFISISDFSLSQSIEVKFFSFAPFWSEKHEAFKNNQYSTIFLLPYLITNDEITLTNYLDQKLLRVYLNKSKYTTMFSGYDDYYVACIKYDDLLPFLIRNKYKNKFVIIETPNMIKLSKFIYLSFNENQDYNYEYINKINNKFIYRYKEDNTLIVPEYNEHFIKKMSIYGQYSANYCYVSFVVVSRNDNYGADMRNRLDNYMKSIADGMDMFPNAKIDFVIADYDSPNGKILINNLSIPYPLNTVTSTIVINREQHLNIENFTGRKLDFNEFAGKNIALRYSKAEFILNTNLDLYFPKFLIEIFSLEQFNKNIFYYTSRQDQKKAVTYNSDEYLANFNKVERTFINSKRLYFHSQEKQGDIWGPGDFQLASNEYYKMLSGYPQYYFNWGIDWVWVFQSSRLLTQGITFDLAVPVFHQYHATHVRTRTTFHDDITKKLICKGYVDDFNFSYHNDPKYFGFPWLAFERIKYPH